MEIKDKLVAVCYDKDNNCTQVAKVMNVTTKEYNKLLNDEAKYKSICEEKEKDFVDWTRTTIERIVSLENRTLVLAKSIYDNFVDRGLIENDDDFQKAWFDFYFNDKELVIEQYPNEFNKILEKVRNL